MDYTITEADLDAAEERLKAFMASHPGFDPAEDMFDGPWDEQLARMDYDRLIRYGRIKPPPPSRRIAAKQPEALCKGMVP